MAAEYLVAMGAKLKQRRRELGLTQEEVARQMPGKVTGNRVSLWERGKHRPHDDSLEALAAVLQVPVSYFVVPESDANTASPTPDPFASAEPPEWARELADQVGVIRALLAEQSALLAELKGLLRPDEEGASETGRALGAYIEERMLDVLRRRDGEEGPEEPPGEEPQRRIS